MPKQKIRGRYELNHYNKNAGQVYGKVKEDLYGKRAKPVSGSDWRVTHRSAFMGSFVTPENRNEYMQKQAAAFKENYTKDVELELQKIQENENLTEEEIAKKVEEFNRSRLSERAVELLSMRFARYQSNKEKKHYKAWLRGKEFFTYRGDTFPVITERFLKNSKSIKDIVKVEDNGEGTDSE